MDGQSLIIIGILLLTVGVILLAGAQAALFAWLIRFRKEP